MLREKAAEVARSRLEESEADILINALGIRHTGMYIGRKVDYSTKELKSEYLVKIMAGKLGWSKKAGPKRTIIFTKGQEKVKYDPWFQFLSVPNPVGIN